MISPLVSPIVARLPAYVPGRSIDAVKRELGLREIIKLASNESPFGPSPRGVEAMRRALSDAYRYPGEGMALREALADRLAVRPGQIVLGAGATDLIELCVRTFATADGHALISEGSFVAYRLFLLAAGVPHDLVPLARWDIDLDALAAAVRPNTQIVFLPNPNNPTGSCFDAQALERFLARLPEHVVLVLDDAYRDYCDAPIDTVGVLRRRPRTVVLRSFSKAHGLAGMRVGYAISSDELVDALGRVHRPFAVSGVALEGARAALDDHEHVERTVTGTRSGRARLSAAFAELGLTVLPSQANFVAVELADRAAADRMVERLLEQGIIIRPLAAFGMPSYVRFSVGSARECERAIDGVARAVHEAPGLCGTSSGGP